MGIDKHVIKAIVALIIAQHRGVEILEIRLDY